MDTLPTASVGSWGQLSPLLWEMLRFLTLPFMPNGDKTLTYSNFINIFQKKRKHQQKKQFTFSNETKVLIQIQDILIHTKIFVSD